MGRLILAIAATIGTLAAPALVDAKNLHDLPKRIAKRCSTPPEWVSVAGKNEVYLQPLTDADYSKVDCILKELQPKNSLKLGFV
jgi:hypothetical protein